MLCFELISRAFQRLSFQISWIKLDSPLLGIGTVVGVFLNNGYTVPIFNDTGQIPFLNHLFIRFANAAEMSSLQLFANFEEISSMFVTES